MSAICHFPDHRSESLERQPENALALALGAHVDTRFQRKQLPLPAKRGEGFMLVTFVNIGSLTVFGGIAGPGQLGRIFVSA
jgi:hypothetical protein